MSGRDTWTRAHAAVGHVATGPLRLMLAYRTVRGKEDRARLNERLGIASLDRPTGPLIWVHAASVGETNLVMPLIEAITRMGLRVLLTTGTVTSAEIAARRLPFGAFHQFVPVDAPKYVRRFLDHWQPEIALFVESELWPGLIFALAERGIPPILVNGRLSPRSAARWAKAKGFRNALFGRLKLVLAQSDDDGARFKDAGALEVGVTGNIKFDVRELGYDAEALRQLEEATSGRRVWLAASTHPGEEAIAAEALELLKARDPRVLLVIAPRHPNRGTDLEAMLTARGLRVARRSAGAAPTAETEVYLADTIGELGLFYRLAPVAFIGGSLIPHGGQNPIEAIKLGVDVVHGAHVHNFKIVYKALEAAGATRAIENAHGLAAAVAKGFARTDDRQRRVDVAQAVCQDLGGALQRTLDALSPHLNALTLAASLARHEDNR
jgi:3-deoxy-D-manno-octulosonic-acid transferase